MSDDIVKSIDEFVYGEYYFIRRKTSTRETIGEYSWILTILDQDTVGIVGNKRGITYYYPDANVFTALEVVDYQKITSEYHKLWIEKKFEFEGVYIDRTTIETKKDILKLTDPEIPIGSRFFGLRKFEIEFYRDDDFSLGIVNKIRYPDDLFCNLETDILSGYDYNKEQQEFHRYYRGCKMVGNYELAIPWDDEIYNNIYLPWLSKSIKTYKQIIL